MALKNETEVFVDYNDDNDDDDDDDYDDDDVDRLLDYK